MQNVHFKTNILLKNIIGKDLITDDNIAVLELVKNAYDAGSPIVDLHFCSVKSESMSSDSQDDNNGQILICDKGVGMDLDGLVGKWLNIAYSEKKDQSWMNGRRQAGNKGVGRFSCDRLGKKLIIFTKTKDSPCFKLSIDWAIFENENNIDKQIQDVNLQLEEVSTQEVLDITEWTEFSHGTVLDIRELRDSWNPAKIIRLKRDLEKFINPNQTFQKNPFIIKIQAKEYLDYDKTQTFPKDKINGIVENQVFNKLNFRTSSIVSYIDKLGQSIVTKLYDRGREVFTLKEANGYLHLRNIKITIFYLNTYTKRYFAQQTGFRSVDFGSIFLFVNGFRIPPYGDQGDDWLGIERRKSSGFRRYLSTREVIGRIEINDDENEFNIITNRSGVVHNDAFDELSREGSPYGFFYKTFRRLERFVVEGINWDKTGDIPSDNANGEEKYKLDDFTRNKQILSVIRKIIDIPDSSIENLHINEELVQEILEQQVEDTKKTLNEMLAHLADITQSLDVENMQNFQNRLQEDSEELDQLIKVVNVFSPSSEKLTEINAVKEFVEQKQQEIANKQKELEASQKARVDAEEKARKAQEELKLEKEKNTYLLSSDRSMSEDAKGMVHNIKLIALTLQAKLDNLIADIRDEDVSKVEILQALSSMRYQNEKSLKISKLITRANFRADKENRLINVMGYIKQYLEIYKDVTGRTNITFVVSNGNLNYSRKISTLDISVILDNMISNSVKASASVVAISAQINDMGKLEVVISDNGEGLPKRFLDNPEKVFELGVTSTDGSGLGLYTVRDILKEMGSTIRFIGNNVRMKGASFLITF